MESVSTGIHYRRPLKWAAIEHPHWKRRETDQSPRTDNCQQKKQKKELPPSTPASWWSISLGQQHSSLPGWKKGHNSSSQGEKRDGVNGREWEWRWHVNKSDGILPLYIHSAFPSKLCLLRLKWVASACLFITWERPIECFTRPPWVLRSERGII